MKEYSDKTDCTCGHNQAEHKNWKDDGDVLCGCKICKCFHYNPVYDYKGEIIVEDTDYPVCPYCGERDHDWWDSSASLNHDGDETEFT